MAPTPLPEVLLVPTAAAIQGRYIAGLFQCYSLPRDMAQTVLDAVPDGWYKVDGVWYKALPNG